jgi:hypothetical protein
LRHVSVRTQEFIVPPLTEVEINTVAPRLLQIFSEPLRTLFVTQLLSNPFYLKLAVNLEGRLTSLTQTAMDITALQYELIALWVKQDNVESRMHILRSMIYAKNKASDATRRVKKAEMLSAHNPNLVQVGLIQSGIIVVRDGKFDFSHLLFEEWVVRQIAESFLRNTLESGDKIYNLLATLERQLNYYKPVYATFMQHSDELRNYLQQHYVGNYNANLSVLNNLALIARRCKLTAFSMHYSRERSTFFGNSAVMYADNFR